MLSALHDFFDTAPYVPRWECGEWKASTGYLHIAMDLLIFAAYLTIAFSLIYFVRRRRDVPFPKVFLLFGVFLALCGLTHLLDAVIFYWPVYPASGLMKTLTAAASCLAAAVIIPTIPRALSIRSPLELEREIGERRRAQERLAEKHRQLQEAERLKGEFFANVSHELRTPLTLILSPLESLLLDECETFTENQRRTLATVHNNAVRLLQMVAGLLDFSKLEAGTTTPQRESMDVVEVTRSIVADFQPAARQRSQTLVLETDETPAVVNLDRYLYERIAFNLISNALKFTPEGGKITVSVSRKGDRLHLTVADTGIGISEADRGHLFQKFRQLEGSATRRFEGVGLGLAIVKEFAELLGGKVTVESQPGEGSIFRVDLDVQPTLDESPLPRNRSEGRSSFYPRFALEGSASAEAGGTERPERSRIVIAEDNPELARYIASLLKRICRCHIAEDGEEAARMAREIQPDLVLADIMMPKLDGFGLCSRLKTDPETASIPVILLTAVTHRDALLRGWAAGADEYLFKPFHPEELLARVKSILGAVHARRESEAAKRSAHAELERRVEERTAELLRANQALEQEIAERIRVEERLRRNEERMQRIADSLPGLIAYVDREERYRFANAAHDSWLGISPKQLVGRSIREVLGEERYAEARDRVRAALDGKSVTFESELAEGDRRRYVQGVYVPSFHEDGTVRGFYSLITDITARRQAEVELERAYRQLQQRTNEVEQFVYTVSHDLKSPLVTILGFVGVLQEELREGRFDQVPDAMGRIERAAHRMHELIDGLLELGRIGRIRNQLEPVDVGQLCRQVVADNQHRVNRAGVRVEIQEPLGSVIADRARLAEVFDNLLSNAIKYGIGDSDPKVIIGAEHANGEARFFVRDNGPGIAPEYHQRIFGLFQRLQTNSEGTGLGLAIVAKILESHGGRTWVESAPGAGATFWIALPLLDAQVDDPSVQK